MPFRTRFCLASDLPRLLLLPDRAGGEISIESPEPSHPTLLTPDAWATLTFSKHSSDFIILFLIPCGNLIVYHLVVYNECTGDVLLNTLLSQTMAPILQYARTSNPDQMTLTSNADMTGIAVVVASESLSHFQFLQTPN